jgi:4-hydroxybenzoate polyprenyltransferase
MSVPPGDGRVADAPGRNWVDRFAPAWLRPFARLSRWDRPIGTWLLLLPCWWGLALAAAADPAAGGPGSLWLIPAFAAGAILMRGAGCTWNDFTDRRIDGQVERTRSRPLPSGQVTPRGALIWMVIQALAAFCILLAFNRFSILLGILALGPVLIYPFAKRFTWWPQVFLGIAFNWGALMGWSALTGSLAAAPLLLYAGGLAWTLFYDTIYAHQDREDDALVGIRSTARLFGGATERWLFAFLVASVLLMGLAVISALGPTQRPLALLTALTGCWAFGWHLAWQLRRLDIDNPENCLRLFRSNRDAGLIATAALTLAAFL